MQISFRPMQHEDCLGVIEIFNYYIDHSFASYPEQPVWLLSSGPTGEGDPTELVNGKLLPGSVQTITDRIQPREIAIFHGNIDLEKINAMEKGAIKNVEKKPFGDFRDWEMIHGWTTKIAESLMSH